MPKPQKLRTFFLSISLFPFLPAMASSDTSYHSNARRPLSFAIGEPQTSHASTVIEPSESSAMEPSQHEKLYVAEYFSHEWYKSLNAEPTAEVLYVQAALRDKKDKLLQRYMAECKSSFGRDRALWFLNADLKQYQYDALRAFFLTMKRYSDSYHLPLHTVGTVRQIIRAYVQEFDKKDEATIKSLRQLIMKSPVIPTSSGPIKLPVRSTALRQIVSEELTALPVEIDYSGRIGIPLFIATTDLSGLSRGSLLLLSTARENSGAVRLTPGVFQLNHTMFSIHDKTRNYIALLKQFMRRHQEIDATLRLHMPNNLIDLIDGYSRHRIPQPIADYLAQMPEPKITAAEPIIKDEDMLGENLTFLLAQNDKPGLLSWLDED